MRGTDVTEPDLPQTIPGVLAPTIFFLGLNGVFGNLTELRGFEQDCLTGSYHPSIARSLARKLVNGGFIRAIELVPPRGHAPSSALDEGIANLVADMHDAAMTPSTPGASWTAKRPTHSWRPPRMFQTAKAESPWLETIR